MSGPNGNSSFRWDHSLAAVKVENLRRFAALADELNFTRAARRLHISQQVLSSQIKELERAVGVTLFERTTHRVVLTPAGQAFLSSVRAMLGTLHEGLRECHAVAASEPARLRVGFIAQGGGTMQSEVLRMIRERHPHVRIQTRSFPFTDPFAGLLGGDSDIAFLPHPPDHAGIAVATLLEESRVVLVPHGHQLARFAELTPAQLAHVPAIAIRGHRSDPVIRDWVATHALRAEAGTRPVSVEVETAEEWLQAACDGLGFTTIPASVLDYYRRPGLVGVPVVQVPPLRMVLGWRRELEADPVVRSVIAAGRHLARTRSGIAPAPPGRPRAVAGPTARRRRSSA